MHACTEMFDRIECKYNRTRRGFMFGVSTSPERYWHVLAKGPLQSLHAQNMIKYARTIGATRGLCHSLSSNPWTTSHSIPMEFPVIRSAWQAGPCQCFSMCCPCSFPPKGRRPRARPGSQRPCSGVNAIPLGGPVGTSQEVPLLLRGRSRFRCSVEGFE